MQNSKRCIIKHLRRPMTGWSALAERTSFLMLTEEWTRLPIAPTCQIRTQMLTRIKKTVNVRNAPTATRWTLQSIDSKKVPPMVGYHLQSCNQCISMDFPMINMPTKVYMQVHVWQGNLKTFGTSRVLICAFSLVIQCHQAAKQQTN
jgi:hypothetical protein